MNAAPAHAATVKPWRLLAGLFGAPMAWLIQMSLSAPGTAQACYPGDHPLPAPLWPALPGLLWTLNGCCLLLALACTWVAWSNWRAIRCEAGANPSPATGSSNGRICFVALLGAMSSLLFLAAILFTAMALVLVAPCAKAGA